MVSLQPPMCDFGWKARPFDLPGVDGKRHTLESARGKNGLLVMFICNHCPYVKSVRDRIIRDARELQQHGINSIAIMSNDPADYRGRLVRQHETGCAAVRLIHSPMCGMRRNRSPRTTARYARRISSASTPIWNCNTAAGWMPRARKPVPDAPRDLFNAMVQVAKTGQGPREQIASMGCSIKWK